MDDIIRRQRFSELEIAQETVDRLTDELFPHIKETIGRREWLISGGAGAAMIVLGGSQIGCGISKEKAVKYTGIAIDYLKDILPIASQLGGTQITNLIHKAIPTLESLKSALSNSDFSLAGNFFDQVTGILGQVSNALFQLPESDKRNQIMSILTLVNITLRTISLFVKTETPAASMPSVPGSVIQAGATDAIRRAHDATRFP